MMRVRISYLTATIAKEIASLGDQSKAWYPSCRKGAEKEVSGGLTPFMAQFFILLQFCSGVLSASSSVLCLPVHVLTFYALVIAVLIQDRSYSQELSP